jgi:hypothetical protein
MGRRALGPRGFTGRGNLDLFPIDRRARAFSRRCFALAT